VQAGQRRHEAVREQNTEEGADQRMGDQDAQLGRWQTDVFHGVDHAHHRRHDTESRHAVAEAGNRVGRRGALVVVGIDLVVHQVFDLERIHIPGHHQAQVIGNEFDDVMVGQHARVLGKDRTLFGAVDIAFDRHQALFANLGQHVEHQRHELHVQVFIEARPLEQLGQGAHGCLDGLGIVTGNEGAKGAAADHHQFERLEQRSQVPARHGVTAKDADHDDYITDDDKQVRLPKKKKGQNINLRRPDFIKFTCRTTIACLSAPGQANNA